MATISNLDQLDVRLAYETVLLREPEAAGWVYWTQQASSGNLGYFKIADLLSKSVEGVSVQKSAEVASIYAVFLGREPDAQGFGFWNDLYQANKITLQQISESFASSVEYKKLYSSALNNEQLVSQMYANLYGHAAPSSVKSAYVAELDAGKTVAEVMVDIIENSQNKFLNADSSLISDYGYSQLHSLKNIGQFFPFHALTPPTISDASLSAQVKSVETGANWAASTNNVASPATSKVLNGTPNDDYLWARPDGAYTVNGLGGNDQIISNGLDSILNGDDGNDKLELEGVSLGRSVNSNNTINGGAGDDILQSYAWLTGVNSFSGGVGNDLIAVKLQQIGSNTFDGGEGFDVLQYNLLDEPEVVFTNANLKNIEKVIFKGQTMTGTIASFQQGGALSDFEVSVWDSFKMRKEAVAFSAAQVGSQAEVDKAGEWFVSSTGGNGTLTYFDELLNKATQINLVSMSSSLKASVFAGDISITFA